MGSADIDEDRGDAGSVDYALTSHERGDRMDVIGLDHRYALTSDESHTWRDSSSNISRGRERTDAPWLRVMRCGLSEWSPAAVWQGR